MENKIIGINENITRSFQSVIKDSKIIYTYFCSADAVYGLGERYCSVNHKGRTLVNRVFEQFTRQGEHTYLPIPFYHAGDGHGVFVDTLCEAVFSFEKNTVRIEIEEGAPHTLYFYYGSPKEIIGKFLAATGKSILPPKWAFGVWASANRWNCQRDILEQLKIIEENQYPVSVMVIEAWSDEATFYIWNGAEYRSCGGDTIPELKDFTFKDPWPDPMEMIRQIHKKGIKLILWQIPALKLLEEGRSVPRHENDCLYAMEQELMVKSEDGSPYRISRQWFIGSMVPDFSNPDTVSWWGDKRKYLMEQMQIDGFKTDGGEFIHDLQVNFHAGYDGRQGRNAYPALYEQAYHHMAGEGRVLFSRAGYLGAQTTPMHWAGDQVSDFDELKSVLNAGLSLSLSGIPFWSFDIGGFAGPLPDKELYLRATAFAAFVPAMQWHSEPAGGQFEEIMKGSGGTNDRSPWNMAFVYQDRDILDTARFFADLHMNFMPYFYSEAIKSVKESIPFMKHLILEYPNDKTASLCEDEYMIGDLLIAPVCDQGIKERSVYLPEGSWYDFWTGERLTGGQAVTKSVPLNRIPLYLRGNGALIMNFNASLKMGGHVSNTGEYDSLYLLYGDAEAGYDFCDDQGNCFKWCAGSKYTEELKLTVMTVTEYVNMINNSYK